MTDYRTFLRAVGRKPIPKNLRTEKKPGDVEIVFCPKARDWIAHRAPSDIERGRGNG